MCGHMTALSSAGGLALKWCDRPAAPGSLWNFAFIGSVWKYITIMSNTNHLVADGSNTSSEDVTIGRPHVRGIDLLRDPILNKVSLVQIMDVYIRLFP